MLQIQCVRCNKSGYASEMFKLGSIDEKGKFLYSCEGCLLSFEQDWFYKQQYVYKLPEPEILMQMAA